MIQAAIPRRLDSVPIQVMRTRPQVSGRSHNRNIYRRSLDTVLRRQDYDLSHKNAGEVNVEEEQAMARVII